MARNLGRGVSSSATMGRKLSSIPIANEFARKANKIPGVTGVYAKESPQGLLHLWTVVDQDKLELRERVYEAIGSIYDEYPNARIDFFVLTLEKEGHKPLESAIPLDFVRVPA